MNSDISLTNTSFNYLSNSSEFLNIVLSNISSCVLLLNEHMELQAYNDALKTILPIETSTMVGFNSLLEAHYFCALINSKAFRFAVISYSVESTGGFGSPHILKRVCIPKFDPQNQIHLCLSDFSEQAHQAAEIDDKTKLNIIEDEIDKASTRVWDLTNSEFKELKLALEEHAE